MNFSFSEDPGSSFFWNGSIGDVSVSGGSLSAISGTGSTRTATFTPATNTNAGTASVTVSAGLYSDAVGNSGGAGNTPTLTFDTQAPSLVSSITISDTALQFGDIATVTFVFTEAVSGFTTENLAAPTATISNLTTGDSGITWTASLAPTTSTSIASNVITLDYNGITDLAGNTGTGFATSGNYSVDTGAPSVLAVRSTTANGTYGVGDTITLAVQFSEGLVITGSPQLKLETGSTDQVASYTGLATSAIANDTLKFSYTVQAGDSSEDLDQFSANAIEINGAILKDSHGNDAILSLSLPGASGSLAANRALTIDTNPSSAGQDHDGALNSYELGKDVNCDGIDDALQSAVATFEARQGPSSLASKSVVLNQKIDPLTGGTVVANTLLFFDNATNDPNADSGLQLSVRRANPTATVASTSDLISFTVTPTVTTSGDISGLNVATIRDNAIAAFGSTIQEVDIYFSERPSGSSWNSLYKKNKNGEYYLFNYNALTGLGAMLLDRNNNGSIDGARLYLKDGALGDFDETVNGRIGDPIGFTTLSETPTLRISSDGKSLTVDGLAGTGLWLSLAMSSFSALSQSNLEMYNNDQPLGAIGATLGSGPMGSQAIYLAAGSTLSFRSSDGADNSSNNPALTIASTPTGYSLGLDADRNGSYTDLMLDISSSIAASSPASLAIARKQLSSSDAILDLTSIAATGITLSLDISTDCGLRNRFGFVKLDPLTGSTYQVAGVSQNDGAAFRSAVLSQFIDPYLSTGTSHLYNQSRQSITWNLDSSAAGYYAPVMITQGGEVLTFGASTASDGRQHVKLLGTNTFGFEDLLASQGSDWDFNDTKIRVSVV